MNGTSEISNFSQKIEKFSQKISEISKAFEMVINKFKEFFKNEIVNIFARKISKSLESERLKIIQKFIFSQKVPKQ